MRTGFHEDWLGGAERLPFHVIDRVRRAYVSSSDSHRVRSRHGSGRIARAAHHARLMRIAPPAPRRRPNPTTGHNRTLTQPVPPHRQERLLENHSLVAAPADLAPPDERRYRDADGLITMCVACHRMQRPGTEEWDRIPQWESSPPSEVTGGLCVSCFQQHYARYLPKSDDAVA